MNKFLSFILENKKTAILLALAVLGLLIACAFSSGDTATSEESSLSEYELDLENQLSSLCSSVKGVGKCRVHVSFATGEENIYRGGVLIETKPPRVLGVVVVCDGGDKASVRAELSELLSALFDIGSNRIKISKLK
jgi:stage III sporulation protein AG